MSKHGTPMYTHVINNILAHPISAFLLHPRTGRLQKFADNNDVTASKTERLYR